MIAPALATLAGILIWTGEFDHGEQWLDRARRATQSGGEPGIRLLVHLISAILPAARGGTTRRWPSSPPPGRCRHSWPGSTR